MVDNYNVRLVDILSNEPPKPGKRFSFEQWVQRYDDNAQLGTIRTELNEYDEQRFDAEFRYREWKFDLIQTVVKYADNEIGGDDARVSWIASLLGLSFPELLKRLRHEFLWSK